MHGHFPSGSAPIRRSKPPITAAQFSSPNRTMFPTAAGRMDQARISEMCGFYGHEFVFILGSQIRETPDGIIAAYQQFIQNLS